MISHIIHIYTYSVKKKQPHVQKTRISRSLSHVKESHLQLFFSKKKHPSTSVMVENVRNTHGTMSGIPRSFQCPWSLWCLSGTSGRHLPPGKMPRCTGECWETQSRKGVTKKSAVVSHVLYMVSWLFTMCIYIYVYTLSIYGIYDWYIIPYACKWTRWSMIYSKPRSSVTPAWARHVAAWHPSGWFFLFEMEVESLEVETFWHSDWWKMWAS